MKLTIEGQDKEDIIDSLTRVKHLLEVGNEKGVEGLVSFELKE